MMWTLSKGAITGMKRIGVLVCDSVREPLSARHGEYSDMFARLLSAVRPDLEIVPYPIYAGEYPATPAECDGYVISGSRYSVYDPLPWIARLEAYVRELYAARQPTVGICFGHQMMAQALGGRTERARQGWGIGKHSVEVFKPAAWMQPWAERYAVFVSHQDQVTVLPPKAECLAANAHCPNSMVAIDDVFLGIQGHPEFTGDFACDLVVGRESIYGPALLASALPTYTQAIDSELIARWMLEFLDQRSSPSRRCQSARDSSG